MTGRCFAIAVRMWGRDWMEFLKDIVCVSDDKVSRLSISHESDIYF